MLANSEPKFLKHFELVNKLELIFFTKEIIGPANLYLLIYTKLLAAKKIGNQLELGKLRNKFYYKKNDFNRLAQTLCVITGNILRIRRLFSICYSMY